MRTAAKSRYKSRRWRRLRAFILARDGYRCRHCGGRASEVDHWPRAVAEGGPFWDPANLVAACKPCNAGRGGRLGTARRIYAGAPLRRGPRGVWPGAIDAQD